MLISILLICYLDKKECKKNILFSIIGSFIAIILLGLFLLITGIDFSNFLTQYLFFAGSIGDYRFSDYQFNILDEILNFKYLFYFIIILLVIGFNIILKKSTKKDDFFIIIISIFLVCSLVIHQIMTLNQNYIFF